jgi:hypothetical protein
MFEKHEDHGDRTYYVVKKQFQEFAGVDEGRFHTAARTALLYTLAIGIVGGAAVLGIQAAMNFKATSGVRGGFA